MRKITLIEEEEIVKLYSEKNMGYKTIAKQFKVDGLKIRSILTKNEILITKRKSSRLFEINEDFFEKIDSPEKAYVLGFFWADGNICKKLKTIRFLNHPQEKEILDKISKLIFLEEKEVVTDLKHNRVYLNICSKKMVKDLIDKGCTPRKSLTISFPSENDVPIELQSHFLRGYFDGDGCIWLKNKKLLNLSLCISKPFLVSLEPLLKGMDCKYYVEDIGKIFVLKIIGNFSALKFLNFIYKDKGDYFLNRKFVKFYEGVMSILRENKRIYNKTKIILRETIDLLEINEIPIFFSL